MKRPRSYGEDLMEGDGNSKDWGRREPEGVKMRSLKGLEGESSRPSSYKKSYNGGSRSFGYEKSIDESRMSRKRIEHETDGGLERSRDSYGRVPPRRDREGSRKGFDRIETPRSNRESGYNRDGNDSAKLSPRRLHSAERVRRSSSFSVGCGSKRENYESLKFVGKGFRSERERPKREDVPRFHLSCEGERSHGSEGPCGSGNRWKRSSSRDADEDHHHAQSRSGRTNEAVAEDMVNGSSGISHSKSPQGSKEADESLKSGDSRKVEEMASQSSSSEMEEGELEPEPEVETEPEPEPDPEPALDHEREKEQEQVQPREQQLEYEKVPEPEREREPAPEPAPEHDDVSRKQGKQAIEFVAKVEEEAMETKGDDSEHLEGRAERMNDAFENESRGAEIEESGKGEQLRSMLDLERADDGEQMESFQAAHGTDGLDEIVSDLSGKTETNDGTACCMNDEEIEQQPASVLGIEEKKGIDLEADSKMEIVEASEEIERLDEKCHELTLSFMCGTLNATGGSSGKADEVDKQKFTLQSMDCVETHEEEDTGGDKGKRLALFLSNGPEDFDKWDEKNLLLSSDKKKKSLQEGELGIGLERKSSIGYQGDRHTRPKVEINEIEISDENQRQKKAKLEPLQLSLGLPDTSLTLASPNPNLAPASPARGRSLNLAPGSPGRGRSTNLAPASPGRGRSIQSLSYTAHTTNTAHTRTGSDGFTSISFSGSQPFVHNPSCSLTQNSMENHEFSVGSHPAFQGNSDQVSHGNWNTSYSNEQVSHGNNGMVGSASQDRFKQRREVPLYQKILQNGNLQGSQGMLVGNSRGQPSNDRDSFGYERGATNAVFQGGFSAQGQQLRSSEGSLGRNNGSERQSKILMVPGHQAKSLDGSLGRSNVPERDGIFPRDLSEQWREVRSSPTQSVGSRETRSEQRNQIDKDRSKSERERAVLSQRGLHGMSAEKVVSGAPISPERVLLEIVSEPIPIMRQKLQEMPDNSLEHLGECLRELIGNNKKSKELSTFQAILQRRSDLTSEALLQSHRVQLEILLAVKTGIQDFLKRNSIPDSDLVEVFLQSRCRNMSCRSPLPVDDCECKICSQRNGFCSACMCLVCSKFDSASNTCSWVGCDICMHWCHTDCGIRMSHIKNGRSIKGAPGTTEMQFHCIACEHSSEMFGFVKEVFTTCAKEWGAETLAKELDCVRRIFQGSEDSRGKQLWSKADQMLVKLADKGDPSEVCNRFVAFLAECDSKFTGTARFFSKDSVQSNQRDVSNRAAVSVQETMYNVAPSLNDKIGTSDRARTVLQNYDRDNEGKRTEAVELQYNRVKNKAEIDELESIVRIKQAEASMFQVRADDARREAEGLQRIAIAKNEKIEQEYACKLAKLCLSETEEKRRHKLEELKILEQAQREYYNMKIRMEAEIKELLMKVEATKRQF